MNIQDYLDEVFTAREQQALNALDPLRKELGEIEIQIGAAQRREGEIIATIGRAAEGTESADVIKSCVAGLQGLRAHFDQLQSRMDRVRAEVVKKEREVIAQAHARRVRDEILQIVQKHAEQAGLPGLKAALHKFSN